MNIYHSQNKEPSDYSVSDESLESSNGGFSYKYEHPLSFRQDKFMLTDYEAEVINREYGKNLQPWVKYRSSDLKFLNNNKVDGEKIRDILKGYGFTITHFG